MKGLHKVIVQNNRLHYEFDIKRNITIIQGNSATGKTTLINMLRQAENLGADSGVDVSCDVPCRVLEGRNWKVILESISKSIIFIDEENTFINTEEFASAIQNSDNYYVLITRENLYNLPYSVEEIYGLHSSGKYQNTRKVYQQMYRIYSDENVLPIKPEKIIVEDSNSGYDFFHSVSEDQDLECESAHGKTKIFDLLQKADDRQICVIADGAAIGAEMNRLYKQCQAKKNIHLYLPESFEWIILNSGLLKENVIREILQAPEEYIESSAFFSWERYFTKLLIEQTEGTYLKYKKSRLNKVYLHEKNKDTILKSIKGIKFKNY